MVKVIYIGTYNRNGIFTTNSWIEVIDWLKSYCDSLIIYCCMDYEEIIKLFDHTCDIYRLEPPDKNMNVQTYKLYGFKNNFWNIIKQNNYSIDYIENVSHAYFLNNEKLLCMLEVTDYENYMIIYDVGNNINYSHIISNRELNYDKCNIDKYAIDEMTDGEEWIPY